MMRFAGENVIVFLSLEKLEKRTKSYRDALLEAEALVTVFTFIDLLVFDVY